MTSTQFELTCCTILLGAAAAHAVRKVRAGTEVSLPEIGLWMCALYFGGGPWVAAYYRGGSLPDVDRAVLFGAYAGIALHMAGLLLAARWWRGRGSFGELFRRSGRIDPRLVLGALGVLWVLRATLATRYGVLFSGTFTQERVESLPYVLFASTSIVELVRLGCLGWLFVTLFTRVALRTRRGWLRPLCLAAVLAEGGWAFLQGRNAVLHLVLFGFVGLVCAARRFRPAYLAGGAAVGCVLAGWVFPVFIALRDSYDYSSPYGGVRNLEEAVASRPWAGAGRGRDISEFAEYRRNMGQRPLIVRFNCDIVERQPAWGPMWGRALASTFLWVVPSVLHPDKMAALAPEDGVSHHYGLPLVDVGANWPAYGSADFGPAGGLVAGLVLGAVLLLLERLARRVGPRFPFFALCATGGGLAAALSGGAAPTETWVLLRGIAIMGGFTVAVRFLARPAPGCAAGTAGGR